MERKTRILARARKALMAGRVVEGRRLFWLAQEWRSTRFAPPHLRYTRARLRSPPMSSASPLLVRRFSRLRCSHVWSRSLRKHDQIVRSLATHTTL